MPRRRSSLTTREAPVTSLCPSTRRAAPGPILAGASPTGWGPGWGSTSARNWRPRLGYEDVSKVNPGIVYCSISGYGQTGPYARKRAHDPQIQGMSGLMDINGDAGGPPTKVGFNISDLVTPLFACYSIVAALREKDRTGLGQHLDASMIDTLVTLMFTENLDEVIERKLPLRTGNVTRAGASGVYHTKDGDVTLTAASDDQWQRLSRALDAPHLLEDPRFSDYQSRLTDLEGTRQAIQDLMSGLTRDEALGRLEASAVPCGPVRTAAEVMADKRFWERGSLQRVRHAGLSEPTSGVGSGFPVVFSGGELEELAGAPTLGMHNEEVYGGLLELGKEELERLKEQGVV